MNDGRLGKCMECAKSDVRANYAARRKQYSDYEKKRFKSPQRKASVNRAQIRRRKKHPQRYKARMAVSNAIRYGKITREDCFYCENPKTQAHHDDYSKPFEIRWVCFKCHREKEHGQIVSI